MKNYLLVTFVLPAAATLAIACLGVMFAQWTLNPLYGFSILNTHNRTGIFVAWVGITAVIWLFAFLANVREKDDEAP